MLLWTSTLTNTKWRPFTVLKPSRTSYVNFRIHSVDREYLSARAEDSGAVDLVPDHDFTDRVSESAKAPDVHCSRRQWLLLASGSAILTEANAKESAAQQSASGFLQPTADELMSQNAVKPTASTGIQAVRTPSINRHVGKVPHYLACLAPLPLLVCFRRC